jgi:hypothetical protein
MLDRLEPILRIVCAGLSVLLLCEIARVVVHGDPLVRTSIPALPTLTVTKPPAPPKDSTNFPTKLKRPKQNDLPSLVEARIDQIKESEILGPFIRPEPMALLGIAGNDAFLRTPDGQTKMIKEGDEAGGIKLLRIGTNRVLVEQDGEKKELTVFAGMGGESLLPPENTSSNNTPTTPKHKETP